MMKGEKVVETIEKFSKCLLFIVLRNENINFVYGCFR